MEIPNLNIRPAIKQNNPSNKNVIKLSMYIINILNNKIKIIIKEIFSISMFQIVDTLSEIGCREE